MFPGCVVKINGFRILTGQTLHNARKTTSKKPTGKNTNKKKLKREPKISRHNDDAFQISIPIFPGLRVHSYKKDEKNIKKWGLKR